MGEAPGWRRGSSAHEQEGVCPMARARESPGWCCLLPEPAALIKQELPAQRTQSHRQGDSRSRGTASSTSDAWDELVAEEMLAEPGTSLLASPLLWAAAGPATKPSLKGGTAGIL